jgi:hypothetical protein
MLAAAIICQKSSTFEIKRDTLSVILAGSGQSAMEDCSWMPCQLLQAVSWMQIEEVSTKKS